MCGVKSNPWLVTGIGESNGVTVQINLYAPAESQVLTENGRLAHLALSPRRAGLRRAPFFSVAEQAGRNIRNTSVRLVQRIHMGWRLDASTRQNQAST